MTTLSASVPCDPQTDVLDYFDRTGPVVGGVWQEFNGIDQYNIINNQLKAVGNIADMRLMWPGTLGVTQEAYVKLMSFSAASSNVSLILKKQATNDSAIYVRFAPAQNSITVFTLDWSDGGRIDRGTITNVNFTAGQQLGARIYSDGWVHIYRNQDTLGLIDVRAWQYYGATGSIGLSEDNPQAPVLDNFGGGTVDCPNSPNTPDPVVIPVGTLDSFNRASGVIGSNWTGNYTGLVQYKITSQQLDVVQNQVGMTILWNAPFGATQEAYVTLSTIDLAAAAMGVVLKHQSGETAAYVYYVPGQNKVVIETFDGANGWVTRGTINNAGMTSGTRLGAKIAVNGVVTVYKDGTSIGTTNVSAWPYAAATTGRIGITVDNAPNAFLDDFGGGNAAP